MGMPRTRSGRLVIFHKISTQVDRLGYTEELSLILMFQGKKKFILVTVWEELGKTDGCRYKYGRVTCSFLRLDTRPLEVG